MPWDEPGRDGGRDPWGNRNQGSGPPDLDEVLRKLQEKLGALLGARRPRGGGSSGGGGAAGGQAAFWGVVGIVALGLLLWEVSYIIQPAERGVVLRFGAYVGTLEPGYNIRLPRPIERVERVNVDQIRSISHRAAMLTQDENIAEVEMAVQYKVKDAVEYLFNTPDPDLTVKQAMETAIREVIGSSKMDFVLTEGRSEIAASTKDLLVSILDDYKTGILVDSINIRAAQAPEEVKSAFDDAIKAREDEQRLINEAEAYRNDVLPKARGAAARLREEAAAYKDQVVARAQGDAARFTQLLAAYGESPTALRERLYIETMESVLGNSTKVLMDLPQEGNLTLLPLDRLLGRSTSPTPLPEAPAADNRASSTSAVTNVPRDRSSGREREMR